MKNIGIDARFWGGKQGGLGRYVEQLILHLEKLNPSANFFIFLRQDNWDQYVPSHPNFKKVLADIPWYGLEEQTKFPKILKEYSLDLMHFPHWNIPLSYNRPFVVTIHDLISLHFPRRRATTRGRLTFGVKQLGFKIALRYAAKKSRQIITVSEFSKKDIAETISISPAKISVTHLAPFGNQNKDPEIFKKINLDAPYILYVGVAFPHKNLERLLEAWKNSGLSKKYRLVLAGQKNYFYERLLEENKELFESGSVISTGFVSDAELSSLYEKTSLFVTPSLFEGFGIPPLEAMAHGVPVAASRASCLPEILGDAAIYFDPEKIDCIKKAIETGLTDGNLRQKMIELGKKKATEYSWERTAEKTWEIYKNVV